MCTFTAATITDCQVDSKRDIWKQIICFMVIVDPGGQHRIKLSEIRKGIGKDR